MYKYPTTLRMAGVSKVKDDWLFFKETWMEAGILKYLEQLQNQ